MKCVCIRKCQARTDTGHVQFYRKGEVAMFTKCPPHFRELNTGFKIDFCTASEELMMEHTWSFQDANECMEKNYGVNLKKTSKEDVVSQIMDIRYRNSIKPGKTTE